MLDRASALTLLNTFETYLKTIPFIQSEHDEIFKSYYNLKAILTKEPYDKTALIDFFTEYRKPKESNNRDLFEESNAFSKPQNYIEKIITFLIDIENYSLYDGNQLKLDYNFVSPFKKIRTFIVDPNFSSYYRCIAFSHFEFLIKSRNVQKLQYYSRKRLNPNKTNYEYNREQEEINIIFSANLSKLIHLIENPTYSEEMITAEFFTMINVFPSKFFESIVILIKNLIAEFISDEVTLNLHRFFLTTNEKNQLMTILNLDLEYNITSLLKQICSSTLNLTLNILNISPNREPFQEIVTNNNPDFQISNNLNLIYFGGSEPFYVIGYYFDENVSKIIKENKNHAFYSMQTKKDNLFDIGKKELEMNLPSKETISLSTTPKLKNKGDYLSENILEFSIPSERKHSFKVNYVKYDDPGQQKKLFKQKEEENRKFDFLKRAPYLFDFVKAILQKNEINETSLQKNDITEQIVLGKEKSTDYLISYKAIASNNNLVPNEKYESEFDHQYKRKLSIEKNNDNNMFLNQIGNYESKQNDGKEEIFYRVCVKCHKEFFTAFSFDGYSKNNREYCSNCL